MYQVQCTIFKLINLQNAWAHLELSRML